MRSLRLSWMVLPLLAASPALASEHLSRISEVQLAPQPYIELDDGGDGPFPGGPYELVVTDATGGAVGSVTLTALANQTGGDRFFVAGGAGYTGPADAPAATFAFTLPASGMVCLENAANTRIHCFAWGTVTNTLGAAPSLGPSPGSGQSVARQNTGMYVLNTPTPNAANAVVTNDGGLPTDGGGTPDAITPVDMDDDGCACEVGGNKHKMTRTLGALSLLVLGFWLLRRK